MFKDGFRRERDREKRRRAAAAASFFFPFYIGKDASGAEGETETDQVRDLEKGERPQRSDIL